MVLENARILVTGGAGFIGSFVVAELLKYPVKEIIIYDNFTRGKMENINAVSYTHLDVYKRQTINPMI